MSGPSIYLTIPEASLFKFPPDDLPPALPPPSDERTWKAPFPISFDVYNQALDFKVPATIAVTYTFTVLLLNAYNRRRANKPWRISTTRSFQAFVVLHNVFLAVYSGVTFYAMLRAVRATWPGFDNSNGPAGMADALCKVNGPRGLGDAAYFNTTSNIWETKNTLIKLMPEGTPDPTDVGRLWNEGLAFWGWFFYLSKFYEVVDTFIIIAKGKRSATLQTYHHAGAMLCMWAGIRYMSPPIWMFVFINSFIHTLMYTYFTLSAINIRVPTAIKRTLTTMQIAQFLFGATFAAAHLFIKYDIPVSSAYTIFHPISSAVAEASSTVSSAISAAAPTESYGAILRRILLRAAGDEGVAENVRDSQGNYIMEEAKEAVQRYHQETRYTTDYRPVNCVDTTGQSFAIWLNIFYLAPLTILFIRFFIRAYLHRSGAPKSRTKHHSATRAAIEAAKSVDREVDDVGKAVEKKVNDSADGIHPDIKKDIEAMLKDGKLRRDTRPVSERVQSFERKHTPTKKELQKFKQEATDAANELKTRVKKENTGNDESAQDHAHDTLEAPETMSAPSTPSKKKKRKNKKKHNAEEHADHTDGAESGLEMGGDDQDQHGPTSGSSALKEDMKQDLTEKPETDVLVAPAATDVKDAQGGSQDLTVKPETDVLVAPAATDAKDATNSA